MTNEHKRLQASGEWKKWGPYISERQWGTVREDYSDSGMAWESVTHDMARSKAYRWGEDGLGGICDENQKICFSWAFWNTKDPIIKERLFGLSGVEGNHGEDVKELYYYLENTPSHSYMKMLYKYPQKEFPYADLVETNRRKSKQEREYELLDTGIFDQDEYFDIFLEYAKADADDMLLKITVHNRGAEEAPLVIMPTLWFRNTWSSRKEPIKPAMKQTGDSRVHIRHHEMGSYLVYFEEEPDEFAFCNNETNRKKLYGAPNSAKYTKDGINDYLITGKKTISSRKSGTKCAAIYRKTVPANGSVTLKVRFTNLPTKEPFQDFDPVFDQRVNDCNEFYQQVQGEIPSKDHEQIQRQAYAGMLWSKQFYYYNVKEWLDGDEGRAKPPAGRKKGRNSTWTHLDNFDIISMPDKWEYPWYAAWDLAFHCVPLARVDPDFAKGQLLLFLDDRYLHPNGQIPAYEWSFSDVNPPVHAWGVLKVFQIDKEVSGKPDYEFLQKCFHKLLINFTWWVNMKDEEGNNIFEGGFLGLDNIGVFDRNHKVVENSHLEQADATSWMAMFALNMLRISLELAVEYPVYQDTASKFFEHFLFISGAMNKIGDTEVDLWDEEDNFYYDVMHTPHRRNRRMKVRSMVGLIPLFAIEILVDEVYRKLPDFREKLDYFIEKRPQLASLVARWQNPGESERRLLAIIRGFRLNKILERMLDEKEFLSDFGIRALSKYHLENPYELHINGSKLTVEYLPGESDSSFFGGNSNWRGPIWFPMNYLIIASLAKYHDYYGDDFRVKYPAEDGELTSLKEIARKLSERLINIFSKDEKGHRAVYGGNLKMQNDPHFKDYILFYEYFHGDFGEGLGAAHQTGWTGLISEIIHEYYN